MSDRAERRLLASRSASVVFITGLACSRRAPYFDEPFDAVEPRSWAQMSAWISEVPSLGVACTWVRSTLETGTLEDLRKVCSATHHAAFGAWPQQHVGTFRARAAVSPHDASLVAWIDSMPEPAEMDPLVRIHVVLAKELALGGVRPFTEADADQGLELVALRDLLRAEWSLWERGLDDAAARVNVARSLVGAAAISWWSEDNSVPPDALSAAEAGLRCLEQSA